MCFCIYGTSDIVECTTVPPDKDYLIMHFILHGELGFRIQNLITKKNYDDKVLSTLWFNSK